MIRFWDGARARGRLESRRTSESESRHMLTGSLVVFRGDKSTEQREKMAICITRTDNIPHNITKHHKIPQETRMKKARRIITTVARPVNFGGHVVRASFAGRT